MKSTHLFLNYITSTENRFKITPSANPHNHPHQFLFTTSKMQSCIMKTGRPRYLLTSAGKVVKFLVFYVPRGYIPKIWIYIYTGCQQGQYGHNILGGFPKNFKCSKWFFSKKNAKMLYLYKVLFQFLFVLRHANPFATTTWQFHEVPGPQRSGGENLQGALSKVHGSIHTVGWFRNPVNSPLEVGIRSSGPLFTGFFSHHPTGGCYLGFLKHQRCMNLCLFFPWFPLVFHSKNRFINNFHQSWIIQPSQGWKKLQAYLTFGRFQHHRIANTFGTGNRIRNWEETCFP